MRYSVQIVSSAEREFRKLQPSLQDRIASRILSLSDQPRPHGSKKLRDTDYYRIRIGDYRVLYSVDDSHRVVKILDLGHRRDIYR